METRSIQQDATGIECQCDSVFPHNIQTLNTNPRFVSGLYFLWSLGVKSYVSSLKQIATCGAIAMLRFCFGN